MIEIDGEQYLTVKEFAKLIGKPNTYIYHLTTVGNQHRIMKHKKVGAATLIPVSELKEFPFVNYKKRKSRSSFGDM